MGGGTLGAGNGLSGTGALAKHARVDAVDELVGGGCASAFAVAAKVAPTAARHAQRVAGSGSLRHCQWRRGSSRGAGEGAAEPLGGSDGGGDDAAAVAPAKAGGGVRAGESAVDRKGNDARRSPRGIACAPAESTAEGAAGAARLQGPGADVNPGASAGVASTRTGSAPVETAPSAVWRVGAGGRPVAAGGGERADSAVGKSVSEGPSAAGVSGVCGAARESGVAAESTTSPRAGSEAGCGRALPVAAVERTAGGAAPAAESAAFKRAWAAEGLAGRVGGDSGAAAAVPGNQMVRGQMGEGQREARRYGNHVLRRHACA